MSGAPCCSALAAATGSFWRRQLLAAATDWLGARQNWKFKLHSSIGVLRWVLGGVCLDLDFEGFISCRVFGKEGAHPKFERRPAKDRAFEQRSESSNRASNPNIVTAWSCVLPIPRVLSPPLSHCTRLSGLPWTALCPATIPGHLNSALFATLLCGASCVVIGGTSPVPARLN